MHKLDYKIILKSPTIISNFTHNGSAIFIPSSIVIGIIGKKIFDIKNMKNIYDNDDFWNWLLNAGLKVGNAFPSDNRHIYKPAPINLGLYIDNKNRVYNYFNTKSKKKKYKINYPIEFDRYKIYKKHLKYETNFHFGRRKDSADKDIFYYEAINAGTEFSGDIIGPKIELEKLLNLLGSSFSCRIGVSKNTQYGSAILEFKDITLLDKTHINNDCDIEFISNTVFYNKNGLAVCDKEVISSYFSKLFNTKVEIMEIKLITRIERRYIPHWKSDTISEQVILPGSTIRLKLNESIEIDSCIIGERQAEGFGRFIIIPNYDEFELKDNKSDIKKPNNMPTITKEIIINFLNSKLKQTIINKAIKDANEFNIGKIPNSTIGSLLLSLNDGIDKFKTSFTEKLKRTDFQIKLNRVRNQNNTLDMHIKKINEYDFKSEINSSKHKELLEDYQSKTNELLNIYWNYFFRFMLKKKKGDNKNE